MQSLGVKGKLNFGALEQDPDRYPLKIVRVGEWSPEKEAILITGGVHGYETSGVKGAVRFLETEALSYADRFNIAVAPCVSPWSYETLNRWNHLALDPNRGFVEGSAIEESRALYGYCKQHFQEAGADPKNRILVHIDLHEATDSDIKYFQPLTAMKKGDPFDCGERIPDGFFLIQDVNTPNPALEEAVINEVRKITHIAQPEEDGTIYEIKPEQEGVIYTDVAGIAPTMMSPEFALTTEIYPDSSRIENEEELVQAQLAAIRGALNHFDYVRH